jgi:hypothetical protein
LTNGFIARIILVILKPVAGPPVSGIVAAGIANEMKKEGGWSPSFLYAGEL